MKRDIPYSSGGGNKIKKKFNMDHFVGEWVRQKTHIFRGNLGVGEAELIRFKLLFLKIPFCINVDSLKPTILFMKPPGDHFAF